MTLIEMFQAGKLQINQSVRAKRTVMVNKKKRFIKGRVYRVIDIDRNNGLNQTVTLRGEGSTLCLLTIEWGEKFVSPWTAFKMVCH